MQTIKILSFTDPMEFGNWLVTEETGLILSMELLSTGVLIVHTLVTQVFSLN